MATKNKEETMTGKYHESVGRRKTSIARVRVFDGKGDIVVNNHPYTAYFKTPELKKIIDDAFNKVKLPGGHDISIRVRGGGIHSQAEAARHGIARAIVMIAPETRGLLKKEGYLKRDPRMKERRKFGLKKARKAPQWAKR